MASIDMNDPAPCPGLVADQPFPHPDFANPRSPNPICFPDGSGFQQPYGDYGSMEDSSAFVNLDTSTININEIGDLLGITTAQGVLNYGSGMETN
jgi:hypothetical protein